MANFGRDSAAASTSAGALANRKALANIQNTWIVKKEVKKERDVIKEDPEAINKRLKEEKKLLTEQQIKTERDLEYWKNKVKESCPKWRRETMILAKMDSLYAKIRREKNYHDSRDLRFHNPDQTWNHAEFKTLNEYVENLQYLLTMDWDPNQRKLISKLIASLVDPQCSLKEIGDATNALALNLAPNERKKELALKQAGSKLQWLKGTQPPINVAFPSSDEEEDTTRHPGPQRAPTNSPTVSELAIADVDETDLGGARGDDVMEPDDADENDDENLNIEDPDLFSPSVSPTPTTSNTTATANRSLSKEAANKEANSKDIWKQRAEAFAARESQKRDLDKNLL